MSGEVRVRSLGYYLGQLDSSMYDSRGAMNKAARQLRDDDRKRKKVFDDADREFDQWMKGRRLHSMSERRHAVRTGQGSWCSFLGLGGCHNTGVIEGKGGVRMKCGRCNGEGVRLKRKGRRSKARGKAWRP